MSMAQSAVGQPFQQPAMPVAGFTPDQLAAFQNVRDTQGFAQPYFNVGANYLAQGAQPINPNVEKYLNPYASYVLGNMNEVFGQQRRDTTGKLQALAGGVGADRIAVGQGELARQQALGAGQTLAGLYQPALTAAMTAAQSDAQRQQAAGYGIGAMGPAAQAAQLQAIQAQLGTGGLQQQLGQAQLMSPYQQELARLAYPYQQAQFLSGITSQLAPSQGGKQVTQAPAPSPWSQIGGAALTGLGMFGNPFGTIGKGLGGMGGVGMFGAHGGRVPSYQSGGNVGKGSLPFSTGQQQNSSAGSPYASPRAWQLPSYSVMRGGGGQGQTPQTPNMTASPTTPTPETPPVGWPQTSQIMQPPASPTPAGAAALPSNTPPTPAPPMLPPAPGLSAGLPAAPPATVTNQQTSASAGSPYTAPKMIQTVTGQTVPALAEVTPSGIDPLLNRGFAEGGDVEFEDPETASPYMPPPASMHIDEYMPNDIPAFGMTPFQIPPQVQAPPTPQVLPPVRPAGLPMFPPQAPTPNMGPDVLPPPPTNRFAQEEMMPPEAQLAEGVNPFARKGTNVNEALIAAGLGMMAGTSPYAGVNIGKGGLEGLKNVQAQRALRQKERHDELTIGQRAKALLQSAQQFEKTHALREKALSVRENTGKFTLIPGMGLDETGKEVSGAYKMNSKTGEYEFNPGLQITSKAAQRDPAKVAEAKFLVKEGIAPDLATAYKMVNARGTIEKIRTKIAAGEDLTPGEKKAYQDSLKENYINTILKGPEAPVAAPSPSPPPAAPPPIAPSIAPPDAVPNIAPKAPPRPASVPAGSAYSPSRKQWRTPDGKLYDVQGNPVKP